ncbi:MAG: hypothetical protein D4R80_01695 [Deltaproteobacteria bacterium]|nr:MAG: hypothetical protein D4R80_01695 [Deltaproteobacteria bacterium]
MSPLWHSNWKIVPHEAGLRSQFVTSKKGRGGRRYLPYVFMEQGIAMLSGVLNSDRAVQVNIAIMLPARSPSPNR